VPAVVPQRVYNAASRPLLIEVAPPRSTGAVRLAIMDSAGLELLAAAAVRPGIVDLAEAFGPALWSIRSAAYVQVLDDEGPVGSALVLQPMLERLVPLTSIAVHPVRGTPYTRIDGWAVPPETPTPPGEQGSPQEPSPPAPATAPRPSSTTGERGGSTETARDAGVADEHEEAKAAAEASPRAPPPSKGESDTGSPSSGGGAVQSRAAAKELLKSVYFSGFRASIEQDVVLHTTHGDIRIALRPDEAPNTAWNFRELVAAGFYDGTIFHRIVPLDRRGLPFVIQGGDPTASPTGQPAGGDGGPGYWLPLEPSELPHDFGVISMARSDHPDSAGSQFFFALSREGTARLDGQYCAFGYAVDGADVIRAIAEVELADVAAGRPRNPPVVTSAVLVPAPPRTPGAGRPDGPVSAIPPPSRPKREFVPR
jgi:peptidyl-prolyl cis-trans isomerase B (cyclophilin B)